MLVADCEPCCLNAFSVGGETRRAETVAPRAIRISPGGSIEEAINDCPIVRTRANGGGIAIHEASGGSTASTGVVMGAGEEE